MDESPNRPGRLSSYVWLSFASPIAMLIAYLAGSLIARGPQYDAVAPITSALVLGAPLISLYSAFRVLSTPDVPRRTARLVIVGLMSNGVVLLPFVLASFM